MCWHNRELERDLEVYDTIKSIGGVLGYDMVDIMDLMTYNPQYQTEEDLDIFIPSDIEDSRIIVEYDLEVDEEELSTIIEERNGDHDTDDDESIIDLTCEEN
jgi:hypothetical protein